MTILDTFFILFKSNTEELDKGLNESEKKAGGLVEKLKGLDQTSTAAGQGIYKMLGSAAGFLGLGLSVGALTHSIKELAADYDQLTKLAAQFRDTTDAVDGFLDSLSLLGVDEETGVNGLKSLDRAIQDTVLGMGRAKMVFAELGIQVKDAAGKIKPTTAVMEELAGKFSTMEKGTQIRIMERLGLDPALLKLFSADLGALQTRMADIDRSTGFELEEAIKRAEEYTKAQKAMKLEVNTLRMFFEKLIEKFQIAAMPWLTDSLKRTTAVLQGLVGFLMKHSKFVEGVFIAIGGAILYFLVPAAVKGAIAVWAMIAPFALAAAGVIALGAAFALIYEDVMTFFEGGDSLVGRFLERFPIIVDVVGGIADAFKALWETGVKVFDFFYEMWNEPTSAFQKFLNFVLQGIASIMKAIPGMGKLISIGEWASEKVFGKVGTNATGATTQSAIAMGQAALATASASPISSMTSNAISNSKSSTKSIDMKIDKVEVNAPQATDAAGISKQIGTTLGTQMRQAAANYDDGVIA